MKLFPLETRLIIEKVEEEVSLIIKPKEAKDVSDVGIVIEIGPDCIKVKPGDKILFSRYSWTALPFVGRDHKYKGKFLMNEGDVLCIIDESEDK